MRGKRNIGLCIGSDKIAVAEVYTNTEGTVEVDRVSVIDTPDNAFYQGRITDPASIARTIRGLLTEMDIGGVKSVSLAISDEGVITRMQTLPSMSKSETLEALIGEVENYAAMAGGEPAMAFQVADSMAEASGGQVELLFVATPRELLDSYISTMEVTNFKLVAMETTSLAAIRAITNLSGQSEQTGKPVMLITIEENVGMVIILRGKDVQFVHNMESGTRDLRGEMDFRKRELAREINSSVEYYHNTFPDSGQIENAVLLTDGSDIDGFREILESSLNLPVTAPQVPVSTIEGAEEKIADSILSAYAAIGAAIRMHIRDDGSINLLSSSKRAEVASLRKRVILFSVVIFTTILLAVGARVHYDMEADAVEQDLILLQASQNISEADATAQIPVIQSGIKTLTSQIEATDSAMNSIQWPNITRMFEEIRAIIPRSVWLIRLSWTKGNVSFEGFGLDWDAVARFRDVLLDSPYFDPVVVRSETLVEISGRSTVRFRIQCGVKRDKLKGGESKNATI